MAACNLDSVHTHTHLRQVRNIRDIFRYQETIDGALESRRDQEEGDELDSHEQEGGELDSHEEEGGELDSQEEEGGELDSHEEEGGELDSHEEEGGELDSQEEGGGELDSHEEEGGEQDSHEEGGELDSHEEGGGELDSHEEEGGELDSHEEVKLSFAGPGEIKRREVSWTLMKKSDCHLRVQARSRGGRWSWTLKRAQKRSRGGRRSWAQKVGLSFASVVPQQLCYGHCPCDSAPQSR